MEPLDFLRLLYNAKVLVGNSSAGIRECAFLQVPVVNIGTRQHRRDRGYNVLDVGYERTAIRTAIEHWLLQGKPEPSMVYGGGEAGTNMARLLATLPLQFHKTITF
jgi:UDP-N-acetylglucosamine 2-epimerase